MNSSTFTPKSNSILAPNGKPGAHSSSQIFSSTTTSLRIKFHETHHFTSLNHSRCHSSQLADLSLELPENMGSATTIMILILAENSFSGKILISITNISRLLLMDLSKNRLSGTIPVFDPTSFLAYVDLSSNDFSV
ncbi:hypothetical protein RND71_007021 [Anisodus tanguticus]|uniref:Uncharacterized protein n=1 Tax=Anisodus tanguticus TaxID=243964 RepID=A0AAE1SKT6_9SOLA|nr:hypothetical protein RND71_007021 [Anisodus tanguticus]